jgi:hypothetical protein
VRRAGQRRRVMQSEDQRARGEETQQPRDRPQRTVAVADGGLLYPGPRLPG